tara:strand:- start:90 stop:197 length:108 start_codon:yes stop_codon:yes gene_type:complete
MLYLPIPARVEFEKMSEVGIALAARKAAHRQGIAG